MARYRQIDYYKNDGTETLLHYNSDSGLAQKPIDYISQVGKFWGELVPYNWTRTGYVFVEWNTAADGSGDSYHGGEDTPKVYTILYAIWSLYNETQISQGVINLIPQDQYESITPTANEFYLVKDGLEYEDTAKFVNTWNPIVPRLVTPLYQLPKVTTFNGSSTYIDTGIKLCDSDKSFTLFVDFQYSGKSNFMAVVHALRESSPYPGVQIALSSDQTKIRMRYYDETAIANYDTNRHKAIITHEANTRQNGMFYFDNITQASAKTITYSNFSQNTLLGCYQNTSGTKGRYFNGIMYDARIYDRVLSKDQIKCLMNNEVIYDYVPLSEYPEYGVNLCSSAKLVYDALVNHTFNADTKYY